MPRGQWHQRRPHEILTANYTCALSPPSPLSACPSGFTACILYPACLTLPFALPPRGLSHAPHRLSHAIPCPCSPIACLMTPMACIMFPPSCAPLACLISSGLSYAPLCCLSYTPLACLTLPLVCLRSPLSVLRTSSASVLVPLADYVIRRT